MPWDNYLQSRIFLNHFQRFFHKNVTGKFAEQGTADVVVPFEAVEIFLYQNVPEGIVGEAEQKRLVGFHVPFQVKADVGQRFAGNGEHLRFADVQQVQPGGNGAEIAVLIGGI